MLIIDDDVRCSHSSEFMTGHMYIKKNASADSSRESPKNYARQNSPSGTPKNHVIGA
jgi:hypothetical protein